MNKKTFLALAPLILAAAVIAFAGEGASGGGTGQDRKLIFEARSRTGQAGSSADSAASKRQVEWNARETAIIICDMWDRHWCPSATARVAELAPAINEFAAAARAQGVLIVHAPSETMIFYRDYPERLAAHNAPRAVDLPKDMAKGKSYLSLSELQDPPVYDRDGGCDCKGCRSHRAWSRQIASIDIKPEDIISDSGTEMWNVFAQRGIKNVLLVGVHTNMCVVGRPFGLRNWVSHGKNAMLVRDLTDSMYNPEKPPHVDHFTGTDLVVNHIEKYICPSVLSTDITGKPPFRFQDDRRSLQDR